MINIRKAGNKEIARPGLNNPQKKNSRRGETLKAVLLPCPYVSFDGSVLRSAHGLEHDFFIEQA